ncbi:MAG: hypothetical protein UX72_C0051G0010 [Parcubacteria group bacterium GW2011_GWA2_47_10]|nr:MAG: hypothetical protein UX72_C0051G0010 [Parcubacteria group bacterium GW2011_GWA2_47_10]
MPINRANGTARIKVPRYSLIGAPGGIAWVGHANLTLFACFCQ